MMVTSTCQKFLTLDLEWQGITHLNPPGRSIGPGLSRRGEIPPIRITIISNETLQGLPAVSLSSTLNKELFAEIIFH